MKKRLTPIGDHADGGPGEEIAAVVERGEEGDAEAAVGHGIEQAMDPAGEEMGP